MKSKNNLILVDIQGCGFQLYDLEIVTMSSNFDENENLLFCMGNLSDQTKETFFLAS